ncbi:iron chaperone [Actinomycetota bacterium]|nr:DUF1801 domain-containing protein [Micrococcales bacterium]
MARATPPGPADPAAIDGYVAGFAGQAAYPHLVELCALLREIVPEGTGEKIAYQLPTFTYHGNLVHFGGFERHVGFYPGGSPTSVFADELAGYVTGKGSIRLPLDRPLPRDLITRIVAFRVEENLSRMSERNRAKARPKPS